MIKPINIKTSLILALSMVSVLTLGIVSPRVNSQEEIQEGSVNSPDGTQQVFEYRYLMNSDGSIIDEIKYPYTCDFWLYTLDDQSRYCIKDSYLILEKVVPLELK